MDCVLTSSEGRSWVTTFFTVFILRDMMDCVLTSSKVDLGLPHSLQYLY